MGVNVKKQAEDRLDQALAETGAMDPRIPYRQLLRDLKHRSEPEYDHAVALFQESVLEATAAEDADPLSSWLQFGLGLAERLQPGKDVLIDETGRVGPFAPPPSWRDLILHVPEDRRAKAIVVGRPPKLTRAQSATIDLLALGNVRLTDH